MFVPAVIEPVSAAGLPAPLKQRRARRSSAAAIELEIGGVAVRIAQGSDADRITAVIAALKATR